ncbi:short-chain dehydrogenase [Paenibacillus sp. FSL H8-0548]|uniref:SDR family NAD(P)-dependent oxidoreductase n=1 Tax=Paenibacillus sp. FSL H8-0548 TaxID=1920422 RepID=UPI00096D4389|nr:SDR family oxidoreductase [Paenibacillus sp. FSL H8-0548]OMF38369.1 short-chain dehydrogenase [Paenibacillus sp. FSL H8-0548]
MSIAGKIALVTGAGTGIGKEVAIELARRGALVAIHYNQSDAGALHTKQQVDEFGGKAIIVQANVATKQEIEQMVQTVAAHYGGIDILVNNAALQLNYDFFDYDEASFDRMMSINLKGYWQCIQAVVPYMKKKQSGRIINMSSVHSKRPTDFDVVYSMTKGGIRMLGRESAIELAQYGITVNTIEPGAVDVGKQSARESKPIMTTEDIEKHKKTTKSIRDKFPLGRVGRPLDVAQLVCFIASDESEFMTGSAIRLDGGSMLL